MERRVSIAFVAISVILGISTDSGALPLRARGTLVGTPCTIEVKEARFTKEAARYTFVGTCPIHHDGTVPVYTVRWTGQGAVAYTRGFPTEESIVILPPAAGEPAPPYRVQGRIKARWKCFGDKWLEAEGDCGPVTLQTDGTIDYRIVNNLYTGDPSFNRPLTSWLTPETRVALAEQRRYTLDPARRGEAVAVPAPGGPGSGLVPNVPGIIMPEPSPQRARYRAQRPVTIRLTPPPGMTVQTYALRIEKRAPSGAWEFVANLPTVPAAEAEAAGYTGFGGSASGTPANMIASVGTYRLRAQVSSPGTTKPSAWRTFSVVAVDSPERLLTDTFEQTPVRTPSGGGRSTQPQGR